ncbi:hypothetical protein SKAU_G00049930 [Synaphobranchus kaupii]|uniref:Uncharacterized protein n=1 Tax=Synaphobranchus kaupii TaxID=118154 RepID=A0A9Q1G3N0_SYNKA|nr:hypothetical protein SKAU_G00049930 [Synaphobranchus kaupii]
MAEMVMRCCVQVLSEGLALCSIDVVIRQTHWSHRPSHLQPSEFPWPSQLGAERLHHFLHTAPLPTPCQAGWGGRVAARRESARKRTLPPHRPDQKRQRYSSV